MSYIPKPKLSGVRHPTKAVIVLDLPLNPTKYLDSVPVGYISTHNTTKKTKTGYRVSILAYDLISDLQELEGAPENAKEIVGLCQDVLYNAFNKDTPLIIYESNTIQRAFIKKLVEELAVYMYMLPLTMDLVRFE